MPPIKKKITEAELPGVREQLVDDAVRVQRDAHGRLLPGMANVNPSGLSKFEQMLKELPDNVSLDEVLAMRLGKRGAVKLADALIALATGPKATLQAIQTIYDRLEGKPRQAIIDTKDATPEFFKVMEQFFNAEQNKLPVNTVEPTTVNAVSAPRDISYIEAEIREVLSEEA